MALISTRGGAAVSASQAILRGLAPDGGLYVPQTFPEFTPSQIEKMAQMTYQQRAVAVMSAFLDDYTPEEVEEAVFAAYGTQFDDAHIAPVTALSDTLSVLELYHGPTLAFKDMALQILPHLLRMAARKNGEEREIFILVATSGDTGKGALEGFHDVPGTRCAVFYPRDGVSAAQKLQMVTQQGANVHVLAVRGNFDDAQTGVKAIFTNPALRERLADNGMQFSSANSINWGRLLPQIVYYFSAYCDWFADRPEAFGSPINFVVPTGNFGNILAGYYAKRMGLPVNRLICASNENNVLTEFIRTGHYDRNRLFYTTESPSMDILISSNLERLLFDLNGHDSAQIANYMNQLALNGGYQADPALMDTLRATFYGDYCTDMEGRAAMADAFTDDHYLIDPHTAVAAGVYHKYVRNTEDPTETIIVSTASPYKFADSVLRAVAPGVPDDDFARLDALAAATGTEIPAPLRALRDKPVRFTDVCAKTELADAVCRQLQLK